MTANELVEHAIHTHDNVMNREFPGKILTHPATVSVFRNGNYTVALIDNEFVGVSKFNPKDRVYRKPCFVSGSRRAIARAVKQRIQRLSGKRSGR